MPSGHTIGASMELTHVTAHAAPLRPPPKPPRLSKGRAPKLQEFSSDRKLRPPARPREDGSV